MSTDAFLVTSHAGPTMLVESTPKGNQNVEKNRVRGRERGEGFPAPPPPLKQRYGLSPPTLAGGCQFVDGRGKRASSCAGVLRILTSPGAVVGRDFP